MDVGFASNLVCFIPAGVSWDQRNENALGEGSGSSVLQACQIQACMVDWNPRG